MEQQKLPNSTLILVFGIISIVTFCCYGVIGLLFGVIALILAMNAIKTYKENPELYSNIGSVKTGRILAIIGIVLSLLTIAFFAWIISIIGWETLMTQDQELIQEKINEYFNQ